MKLLIVTQALDQDDVILSVYHNWVDELARHFERIEVICLKEGRHELPANVRVHSLGKERGAVMRGIYVWRFLSLAWRFRTEYNAVFVHMNQEYILIAGWLWKLLGKPIYLWRNHYAGSWFTDVAAAFCTKIFCTSKHSYTAKYKKTVLMPVGVDTERFVPDARRVRKPRSILFLARMSPSKRPLMLVDALALLAREGQDFTVSFVGSPLPEDRVFYENLKEKVHSLDLMDSVSFHPGVPNSQTLDIYRAHEIFVNTSPSGMLDKTIFEAAASGCLVLAASEDWKDQAGEDLSCTDTAMLAERLTTLLALNPTEAAVRAASLRTYVVLPNSLARLGEVLQKVLQNTRHAAS